MAEAAGARISFSVRIRVRNRNRVRWPGPILSLTGTASHLKRQSSLRCHSLGRQAGSCAPLALLPRPLPWAALLAMALALGVATVGGQAAAAEERVWAHVLVEGNFSASLDRAQEPWALVEFFASWCPACMHFKPHYEKVSRIFNDPSSPHSDFIYMAKVDCASEGQLCQRFAVGHYPTMLWGKPREIAHGKRGARGTGAGQEAGVDGSTGGEGALEEVETDRTADGLLAWINKRTDKSFSFSGAQSHNQQQQQLDQPGALEQAKAKEKEMEGVKALGALVHGGSSSGSSSSSSRGAAVTAWSQQPRLATVKDMEEATAVALHHVFTALKLDEVSRGPLLAFLDLLAQYHPSSKCREGSSKLKDVLADAWQGKQQALGRRGKHQALLGGAGVLNSSAVLPHAKVCGYDLPSGTWLQCRGSSKDRRGYSCGLWLLFHSLSVRLPDGDPMAGRRLLLGIHDFVAHFFACGPCRKHFMAMAKQTGMRKASTKKEAALWLWKAHNIVNARLAAEEAASGGTRGDPLFPKQQWPLEEQCSTCRRAAAAGEHGDAEGDSGGSSTATAAAAAAPVSWDEDAVYSYLQRYYSHPSSQLLQGQAALEASSGAGAGRAQGGGTGLSGGQGQGQEGNSRQSSALLFWAGFLSLFLASCCVYAVVQGSPFPRSHHHLLPNAARRRKLRSKRLGGIGASHVI